ncbi:MAG: aldo/keto reductase [Bacteroidota bacterium]
MFAKTISFPEIDLQLSRITAGVMNWGVWGKNLDAQGMNRLINACVDMGISSFDHADIYGDYTTEASFGAALRLSPDLSKKIQIITKCGIKLTTPNRPSYKIKSYDTSRSHILESADRSLQHLGIEQIDVFLIHRPSPLMHVEEVAEAFSVLHQSGKVRHFGVSNFSPSQMQLLASAHQLVTNQVEASILHLAPFFDGTFDLCQQWKMPAMIWSPVAGGTIFRNPMDPRNLRIRKVLDQLCQGQEGRTPQKLLYAWLFTHPAQLIPVVGTTSLDRLQSAIDALEVELTREEWFMILEASLDKEVP